MFIPVYEYDQGNIKLLLSLQLKAALLTNLTRYLNEAFQSKHFSVFDKSLARRLSEIYGRCFIMLA